MATLFLDAMLCLACLLAATVPLTQSLQYNKETDRFALLSFKSMISDDPLHALDSWNATLDACQWHGVVCKFRRGQWRVTALYLNSLNLSGTISPSLANLTFLKKLHLAQNRLHGPIPQQLGSLPRLQHLNLSINSLQGGIPSTLCQSSPLRNISLRDNMLQGEIPSGLSNCSQLQILSLMNNSLTGVIPCFLGSLKRLSSLGLAGNRLEAGDWTFMDALSNCSNLQELIVAGNVLHGVLPASVANLSTSLRLLSFAMTQIYGSIPWAISNLANLVVLDFRFNLLTGTIPDSVGRLSKLSIMALAANQLSGLIPPSVGNLSSITDLILVDNNLSGRIPSFLGNLPPLQSLVLGNNNLAGGIEPSLGNLSSLIGLDLAMNQLSGGIPASLGKLPALLQLSASFNLLSGLIPTSLWNHSSLIFLDMGANAFHGALPTDIGQRLPHLQALFMYRNLFHGSIPMSLSNASSLESIELAENDFGGTIPSTLGTLPHLSVLRLGGNQLEADDWSFLTALTNCTNLRTLALQDNVFGGRLPSSIVNLSRTLEQLTLSRTHISGRIPADIGNLIGLRVLDLGLNSLEGTLPGSIGMLSQLHVLYLNGSRISGKIPEALGNLSQLNQLYLGNNSLEGSIPSNLGNCQSLEMLSLELNKLSGTIPEEIFAISRLSQYLNLSHNSFSGPLPSEVGKLKNIQIIDVSNNNLSGEIPKALGECQILEYLYMQRNLFHGPIPFIIDDLKGLQAVDLSHNNLSGSIPEFLGNLNLSYLNLSFNDLEGEVPKIGVFANISAVSVSGNKRLCGGIPELNLPSCSSRVSQGGHWLAKIRIIGSVVGGSFCFILLLCFILLYWVHKSRRQHSAPAGVEGQHGSSLSYAELLKATDGFSAENLIGVGSFGSVYKGKLDQFEEKVVAVKVLNLQQPGASKSFIAECEVLKNIRHRNLVKILTVCSSIDFRGNDFKALVFQLMPNGSLGKWLHPEDDERNNMRKLTLIQRLNIAIEVASAMDYLHRHVPTPIIHCDLKPNNILLDDGMTAHVGDFGLAKFLVRSHSVSFSHTTSSIQLRGSIGYVAPEYGIGNEISTHGDVYSYGILLLEMLTGRRPTDDAFKDGLDLHKFVDMALPYQVIQVIDPYLISEGKDEEDDSDMESINSAKERAHRCILSLLRVGIRCSKKSPMERMQMGEVTLELHAVKDELLQRKVPWKDAAGSSTKEIMR